jgi:hypothetical protein
LVITSVGRAVPLASGRSRYPGNVVSSYGTCTRTKRPAEASITFSQQARPCRNVGSSSDWSGSPSTNISALP